MRRIPVAALIAAAAAAPAPAQVSEVWTVNEASQDLSVIDVASETVVDTVPIGSAASPAPWGLAFSTVPGHEGDFAFVTQGREIVVVDAAKRAVRDRVDAAALAGRPLTLRGCAAVDHREFLDAAGTGETESHLFVAADADGPSGPEPWYLVFDQRALAGLAPPGTPRLLASGPLDPPGTPPDRLGAALEVTPLGTPAGGLFERAWFTIRVAPAAGKPLLRAVLVATARQAGAPFEVRRTTEKTLPAGTAPPEQVTIGAPHDREMTLLPEGPAGEVVNLDARGACAISGAPVAALVEGPGPGGYVTLLLDRQAGTLVRLNDHDCSLESFPAGDGPVDLDATGGFRHGAVYVAARDGDAVTVLHEDDTLSTIPLAPPDPAGCTRCPRSIAVRKIARGPCQVTGLLVDPQQDLDADGSLDVHLTWNSPGCTGVSFQVLCRCDDPNDLQCPCHCPTVPPDPPCVTTPAPPTLAGGGGPLVPAAPPTPWKQLGFTPFDEFLHSGAGEYQGGLEYTVGP